LLKLQSTSTAQHDNHNVSGGNNNDCKDNNNHGDVRDSNIIGGDGDAMHNGSEKQVPAAAEVTPHQTQRMAENVDEASTKPVYWNLPEAAKLFGFNYDEGDNVYNGLVDRCELLRGVLRRPNGYKLIIQQSDEPLLDNQVFQIRNKCVFLIWAYQIALEKMRMNNPRWKKDCCEEAVCQMNEIGFNMTINANIVMNWNIHFKKEEKFHHPNIYVANNIKPKLALFEYFP
jgi:hypothetical protein